jgi:hypothetical protein
MLGLSKPVHFQGASEEMVNMTAIAVYYQEKQKKQNLMFLVEEVKFKPILKMIAHLQGKLVERRHQRKLL